jgi:hypothetical protein
LAGDHDRLVGRRRRRAYRDALGASPLELPPGAAWNRRPKPDHWRSIAALGRSLARAEGLRVPVRITRGRGPSEYQAIGLAILTYQDSGAVADARIWVPPDLPRAAAVDSLLHELAHVLYDQKLGRRAWSAAKRARRDADAHPPGFWAIYGRLYNRWIAAFGS